MCCGQVARQLSDEGAKELYVLWLNGMPKWHLCSRYGIGTPEFTRALSRGEDLCYPKTTQPTLTGAITHVDAL